MKLQIRFLRIIISLGMLTALAVTVPVRAAGTCYVDDSAIGTNNGASWTNAYTNLQSALADTCTEIWVAAGVYKPDPSIRTVSFVLESGTAIYGGFNGTETMLAQRDPNANLSILSGDLNGNDFGFANNSENSYHVVYATGVNNTAVLDGFRITAGNANDPGGDPYNIGGGMYNYNSSSPTLANLVFSGNHADAVGGGMYSHLATSPSLTNVTFSGNTVTSSGGGLGISSSNGVTLTNVTFINNSALLGGGMYTFFTTNNPIMNNVAFYANSATYGAGMYNNNSGNPVMTNVTFSFNTATGGNGGGMYNTSSSPTLTNVTFSENMSNTSGGGMYNASGSTPTLTNVIIAYSTYGGDCVNNASSLNGASSNNLIEDASNACGLTDGVNNNIVGSDPLLGVLSDNGGTTETYLPMSGSPVINAGTNTGCPPTDQRDLSRPQDTTCDIGAVERDVDAPTVTAFGVTSPSLSLTLPIGSFTASDNIAVTGYKITESATPPSADAAGWMASPPSNYTVAANGTYTLYPWVKDRDGNVSAVSGMFATVVVDITLPTVSGSVLASSNPTNASSVNFTVVFSESVTGVDTTDFSLNTTGVTIPSITGVSGSGDTYTVSVNTGSGNGTIRLDVLDDNSILDIVSHSLNGGYTSGENYTIDKTAPTVSSSVRLNGNPTNASSVDFTVTFSEYVTGIDTGDFSLTTTGTVSTPSVTSVTVGPTPGVSFIVSVNTGTGDGTLRLDVPNTASITDLVGNSISGLPYTNGESYTIDKTAPTVVSIVRLESNPSNASDVDYNITFSEEVYGVNLSDFTVSGPSGAAPLVMDATSDNINYAVTVSTGTGDGILKLDVTDDDGITDGAGNALGGTGTSNGNYTSGQTYTIDKTAPTVSSITRAGASPSNAASVNFTVAFSEVVTGVGIADFSLTTTGVTGAAISSVTGTGASRTVKVNTGSGNGTIRLNVPATAIVTDLAGNSLSGLPYNSGQTYTIDKTVTLTLASTAATDGWLLESSEFSNVGGTLNNSTTTFNLGDDASKKQYRGLLSFSTASIPDTAIITGVTLKVKKSGIVGGGNPVSIFQGFFADVKTGFFGTASTLQIADFQAAASKVVGPTSPTPSANVYTLDLTTAKTFINKLSTNGGVTQIRLRFKLDDNGNTIANYLSLFSGNATNTADRPQLVIKYYVP